MAQLLDQYLPQGSLKRGQIVRGRIVRISPTAITVDIGAKCEGAIEGRELDRLDPALVADFKPGDEVSVYVVSMDNPCGEIALSLARAQLASDWQYAKSLQECGEVISVEALFANRGGLIAEVGQLRGFIPASQLASSRCVPRISDPGCLQTLQGIVGERLEVRIVETDPERNRLILSERAVECQTGGERDRFLASLKEGEVYRGRVSNLTDFGAFVDLGGIDGLVHLSELSWKRLGHPSEVLKVGQEVDVLVLNIERERQRVALSVKRLKDDPWVGIADRYQEGQTIDCCITRLTKWGAFACIVGDEAVEGLVHVSELSDYRINHPRELVEPGQVIPLRIVRIEPERHRLALSMRRLEEPAQHQEAVLS